METSTDRVVLRSYRLAFELERRIHRIDRFRIPLPYGLPLEALAYGAALLLGVVALRQVPGAAQVLGLLPLPVQLVFLPGAGAHVLCRTTHDGRRTHEVLSARFLRAVRPRHLIALEPLPGARDLEEHWIIVPDERGPRLVTGTVKGSATVTLCVPVAARVQADRLVVREADDLEPLSAPRHVVLGPAQELCVA